MNVASFRPVVIYAVLLVATYIAFILTPLGQSLDDSSLLGNAELTHRIIRESTAILHHINLWTCVTLAAVLVGITLIRRMSARAFFISAGFGSAVLSAELLKSVLPRPEFDAFYESELINKAIDTFPSGHVTITAAFVLALGCLLRPSDRRWTIIIGAPVTTFVAIGVVVAGWHRPSDALGGAFLAALLVGAAALISKVGVNAALHASHFWETAIPWTLSACVVTPVLILWNPDVTLPVGLSPANFFISLVVVSAACAWTITTFPRRMSNQREAQ